MKYRIIIAVVSMLTAIGASGQSSYADNDPTANSPTGYLGWMDNTNENLDILQNNTLRTRFTSVNWTGLNGLSTTNSSRIFLGIDGSYQTPFSQLQMGYNLPLGLQRDWMHIGLTMGGNEDIMFMGLLERPMPDSPDGQADAVIAWGCNDSITGIGAGPDNLRFLFIADDPVFPPGAPSGDANEEQGRETMRITPMGYVGIGDFSHMPNGLDEQPTQRLDVNGTARMRLMPNDSLNVIITGVKPESQGPDGDYVLNYATIEDIGDQLCDWNIVNGGADVATGYPGACVPGQVLIGTNNQTGSNAKVFMTKDYDGTTLLVDATTGGGIGELAGEFNADNNGGTFATGIVASAQRAGINTGIYGEAGRGIGNTGVRGVAEAAESVNYGIYGYATNTSGINYGVYGVARGTETPEPTNNVGVYGRARDYSSEYNFGGYFTACGGEKNVGVYAEGCDTTELAAHFAGGITVSGPQLALSDENVKIDINNIDSALEIINQLQPKQYYFNTAQYPHLHLQSGLSYGFSAQELQQVLPDVVGAIYHPAKYDSLGTEISPSEELLGVNYKELIAILAAGIKEQQTQIDDQEQTIDDLQASLNNQNDLIAQMMDHMDALTQQVNNCCDGGELKSFHDDQGFNNDQTSPKGNILNQNIPNPFRSQTTISYELEMGGKVMLNIYDKNGKSLTTLVEANQEPGSYRYEWDASGHPAGLYHYALYVDGELLVKKAIKLAD